MRTLKGVSIGKDAVMGRLGRLKVDRKESFDMSDEALFERAVGVSVSKIEETCEYLDGVVSSDILSELHHISDTLQKKGFFTEIFTEIAQGIGLIAALEKKLKSSDDIIAKEAYALIFNIVRGYEDYTCADSGEIAVADFECDVSSAVSIAKSGAIGAVFAGNIGEVGKRIVEAVGIAALIVSIDEIEALRDGERAIIVPKKDTIFISPNIDVIDEFMNEMKREDYENRFEREDIFPVIDILSGEECGFVIDATGEDEEESFKHYRGVIEYIGVGELIVSLSSEITKEQMSEQIRAICRAAVYGRISFAVSVLNKRDYFDICRSFDDACYELSREGREFQERVDIGVLIDGIGGVIFAERISEFADFCLVDTREDERNLSDADKEIFCEGFFEMLLKRISKNNKKIKKRLDK